MSPQVRPRRCAHLWTRASPMTARTPSRPRSHCIRHSLRNVPMRQSLVPFGRRHRGIDAPVALDPYRTHVRGRSPRRARSRRAGVSRQGLPSRLLGLRPGLSDTLLGRADRTRRSLLSRLPRRRRSPSSGEGWRAPGRRPSYSGSASLVPAWRTSRQPSVALEGSSARLGRQLPVTSTQRDHSRQERARTSPQEARKPGRGYLRTSALGCVVPGARGSRRTYPASRLTTLVGSRLAVTRCGPER